MKKRIALFTISVDAADPLLKTNLVALSVPLVTQPAGFGHERFSAKSASGRGPSNGQVLDGGNDLIGPR